MNVGNKKECTGSVSNAALYSNRSDKDESNFIDSKLKGKGVTITGGVKDCFNKLNVD